MIYDPSRTERQHLAISRETFNTALVTRRCTCGRSTTSKQLVDHGKCVARQLADRISTYRKQKTQRAAGSFMEQWRVMPV